MASSGVTVGAVWLNVLPSMKDFGRDLTEQARRAGQPAGQQAGQSVASGMTRGMRNFAATAADTGRRAGQALGRGFSTAAAGGAAALNRFRAGFAGLNSDTVAAAGRMGQLGRATRTALDPAMRPVQNLAAGFRDSQAAASALTGRMGSIGGAARSAFNVAAAPLQNFTAGFRDSNAAASAFTGRMGTLGGTVRSTMTTVGSVTQNALRGAAQPLNNFVAGFQNSATAASAFSGRMGSVGGAVRSALSSAQAGFSNFGAQVREQAAQIETSITGGIGGSLRGLGAQAAGLAAAVGLGALGTSAISAAANIQNTELTLTGLYGSAEAAGDMMGRLKTLAAGSPIDYQAYARASTQLAYMGIEGAQAEGVLRNVGAAITAAGGDSSMMDRATGAMLQMVNSGRVYAAQLGQISDAGIPVFSGLATHFNTNIENVREMVTEGKVSVEDVMSVIENATGDTYQSMVAASEQVTGSMSNQWAIFKDNVVTGLGQMLAPLTASVGPQIAALGQSVGEGLGRIPGILAEIGQSWWFQGIVAGLRAIWDFIAPVVTGLVGMAGAVARPAFAVFGAVLGGIGQALAWVLPHLRPLQPLLFGIAAAMLIAQGASLAYSLALRGVATAKALATIATRAFNVVLKANPIVRVVALLFGLAAAVVWAYQNFEWFRNIVNGAWTMIATGAQWLWSSVLSPVFSAIGFAATWLWVNAILPAAAGIAAAWNAIAAGATWLWVNVLSPVFSFISTAVQVLIAVIFTVLVGPLLIAWNLISAATMWLWSNAIQPAFGAIGAFIGWVWTALILPAVSALVWFWQAVIAPAAIWLWTAVIVPVFQAIGAFISWVWNALIRPALAALVWFWQFVIMPAAMWLWTSVIQPAFNGIALAIQWAWLYMIKPALDALVWLWQNVIAPAAMWLWNSVIKPAFEGIGNIIQWVWLNVISPTFDAVTAGLDWLGRGFDSAVAWITDIWNRLRGATAKPVNFLIGTVWNNGIRRAWNMAADLLPGVDPIGELDLIPEYRAGGLLRGPGTGTSDSILGLSAGGVATARVSNGEFIVREAIARKALPFLSALNAGEGEALQAAGALRRVAPKEYKGRRHGFDQNLPPGFAAGGPMEVRIAEAKKWLSGPARGAPYVYGGDTNPRAGMDCSSMVSAVTHILSGRNANSGRIGTTASMPWGGFAPGLRSAWSVGNKPADHMAGTLDGQNVEQHGPNGTPFRFPSRWGADNGYFTQQWHLPVVGGQFVSGGEGGGGSWIADAIRGFFEDLTNPVIGALRAMVGEPPPQFRKWPPAAATDIRDKLLDFLVGQAPSDGGAGMDVSGISGPVVDQVQQVAHRFGWGGGAEWDAIKRIIHKESTWDPGAANPGSTARGLFQKMTSLYGPVEPTPAGQAAWGLNYIRGRYGTPTAAWAFHQSHGHYDSGGWLPPGYSTVYNGTGKPEAVFTDRQWETLKANVRGGDGATTGEKHYHFHGVRTPEEADLVAARLDFHERTAAL